MTNWRIIPEFPDYEMNKKGEVRNISTKQLKKLQKDSQYALFKHKKVYQRSMNFLLKKVFNIHLEKVGKRKLDTLEKSCSGCQWFASGLCSVKNPGTTCKVESDDSCHKYERRKISESMYDEMDERNKVDEDIAKYQFEDNFIDNPDYVMYNDLAL